VVALLGALLFWALPQPSTVLVPPTIVDARQADFERVHSRSPSPGELLASIEAWASDEIAVREALSLGLDRGDPVVRRRMISKLDALFAATAPPPTDDELQGWLTQHPGRFVEPARLTFDEVFLLERAQAEAMLPQLQSGAAHVGLGDPLPHALGGVHAVPALTSSRGEVFVAGLLQCVPGSWTLLESTWGWHLVRVQQVTAAHTPPLAQIRDAVARDWSAAAPGVQRARAQLRSRYDVRLELP
jgi:peptidyl-prolyl cis-trans isomerase C